MPFALSLGVYLVLAASLAVWLAIAQRWRAGLPAVAIEPRAAVPWGAIEIALAVAVYLLAGRAILGMTGSFAEPPPAEPPAHEILVHAADQPPSAQSAPAPAPSPDPAGSPADGARILTGQIAFEVVTLLACLVFLRWGSRASATDLGWQPGFLTKDIRYGVLGFLAAAPPTLALQWILVQWFPSHHPIVDTLGTRPGPTVFLLATLLAVVVAPLLEEFFFRVMLQGWLESVDDKIRAEQEPAAPSTPARWPMVVSSMVFALVHAGHGPDPIPLFFLALTMGYLYRQTHRLGPSLVLHACFNATSMLVFALNMAAGAPAG